MRVLLTLGRLPVSVELARALHAAGCVVFVAEPQKDPLAGHSRAVQQCFPVPSPARQPEAWRTAMRQITTAQKIDLLVPVAEETPFVAGLAAELPDAVRYAGMDQATTLQLHDKWLFVQLARELDLPVPDSALVEPCARFYPNMAPNDTAEPIERCTCTACVLAGRTRTAIKTRLSCSGSGVRFNPPGLLPSDAPGQLVQQALPGPELCCFCLVVRGLITALATYRALQSSASVAIRLQTVVTPKGIRTWVERWAAAVVYSGMAGFDFMQDEQGRWCALECNPRATSGLHFIPGEAIASSLMGQPASLYQPPPGQACQESWSCLSGAWAATGRWALHPRRCPVPGPLWRRLFSARDVTWHANDPKPFALMCWASRKSLWASITSGTPMVQQVMLDVGWYRSNAAPEVATEPAWPADLPGFLQQLTFGSDGVRYRRTRVTEQLARLKHPIPVVARVEGAMVGCYVLDVRQWQVEQSPCPGWYRGALAVHEQWQGMGVGKALITAARERMRQGADEHRTPFSLGCIDRQNLRSLSLLRHFGGERIGSIELHSRYRQSPRATLALSTLPNTDRAVQSLLETCFADCWLRDCTAEPATWVGWWCCGGIQIAARVVVNEVCVESLGVMFGPALRLMAWAIPAAGSRFHPDRHRYAQFTHIALGTAFDTDGAELSRNRTHWNAFLESVMARSHVHFAMLACDRTSDAGARLATVAGLGKPSEILEIVTLDSPAWMPRSEKQTTGTQLAPVDF